MEPFIPASNSTVTVTACLACVWHALPENQPLSLYIGVVPPKGSLILSLQVILIKETSTWKKETECSLWIYFC